MKWERVGGVMWKKGAAIRSVSAAPAVARSRQRLSSGGKEGRVDDVLGCSFDGTGRGNPFNFNLPTGGCVSGGNTSW